MSYWFLIPFLFFIAIIQATLLPPAPWFGLRVDVPLVLVIAWGMVGPAWQAARWGFILGIFLDLTSGMPFGAQTLALTSIGLALGAGQAIFFRGNIIAPPIATLFGTLVYHLALLAILALTKQPAQWDEVMLRVTLPAALLNTLALPLVYLPLRWFAQRLYPQMDFR
ncbi:MAG: rod shape-determining protein MreD [Chloroflexi bacterium]|nr:rod shape-determining protein MreD [Chloroflexota bacterium]